MVGKSESMQSLPRFSIIIVSVIMHLGWTANRASGYLQSVYWGFESDYDGTEACFPTRRGGAIKDMLLGDSLYSSNPALWLRTCNGRSARFPIL